MDKDFRGRKGEKGRPGTPGLKGQSGDDGLPGPSINVSFLAFEVKIEKVTFELCSAKRDSEVTSNQAVAAITFLRKQTEQKTVEKKEKST
jgi:hypothetical protein